LNLFVGWVDVINFLKVIIWIGYVILRKWCSNHIMDILLKKWWWWRNMHILKTKVKK
jgi:hypothetical protein